MPLTRDGDTTAVQGGLLPISGLPKSVSVVNVGAYTAYVTTLFDNNGDQITSFNQDTSFILFGGAEVTPQYTPVSAASSGDNTIVSGSAGYEIMVLSGAIVASGSVNVKFTDGLAGTPITGVMNFVSNSGVAIPYVPIGNFHTSAGNPLVLNLSGATLVGGWLTYILVT
jgi:hypothetical protein